MAWKKDNDTMRQGEVLGLGGAVPVKDRSNDQSDKVSGTSGQGPTLRPEPEIVEGGTGSLHSGKGATSIDMGAGGEGNDIKP
jgi:hypothetical protein